MTNVVSTGHDVYAVNFGELSRWKDFDHVFATTGVGKAAEDGLKV